MNTLWMPLFIGDYLADTGHLTTLQHGTYFLLIMHYWRTGGLPDDDRQLASIARLSLKQWLSNKPTIQAFFHDGWNHKRIAQERSRASAKYEARSAAGRRGGIEKARKNSGNARVLPDFGQSKHLPPETHQIGDSLVEDTHKRVRAKKRAAQLPSSFTLTEARREVGRRAGLSEQRIELAFERLRNWAIAGGKTYVNWDAVWGNWVISDYQRGNGNGQVNGQINVHKQHPAERCFDLADELERTLGSQTYATGNSPGGGPDADGVL